MIKQYLAYIQDNPKGYWFRAKWFGWGWTPATWQGWVIIAIYIGLILIISSRVDQNSLPVPFILLTLILIVICYLKGEPPHWNWGIPKKKR